MIRPSDSNFARRLPVPLLLALVLSSLATVGCSPSRSSVARELPAFDRIRAHQDRRASIFRILESTGTIELRGTSDGKRSFESCAMDLWRQDDRFALRLRKFGERFLWVGSDGSDWWIFELAAEPSRLMVMPLDVPRPVDVSLEESLLGPRKLLEIAGLQPFDPAAVASAYGIADDGMIRFELEGSSPVGWARLRWTLDPKRLLPRLIRIFYATIMSLFHHNESIFIYEYL